MCRLLGKRISRVWFLITNKGGERMRLKPIVAGLALVAAAEIQAADYSIDLGLEFLHSDNVRKRQSNEVSDLQQSLDTKLIYNNR